MAKYRPARAKKRSISRTPSKRLPLPDEERARFHIIRPCNSMGRTLALPCRVDDDRAVTLDEAAEMTGDSRDALLAIWRGHQPDPDRPRGALPACTMQDVFNALGDKFKFPRTAFAADGTQTAKQIEQMIERMNTAEKAFIRMQRLVLDVTDIAEDDNGLGSVDGVLGWQIELTVLLLDELMTSARRTLLGNWATRAFPTSVAA